MFSCNARGMQPKTQRQSTGDHPSVRPPATWPSPSPLPGLSPGTQIPTLPRPEHSWTTFSSNLAFHALSDPVLEPSKPRFSHFYIVKPSIFLFLHHKTINFQNPQDSLKTSQSAPKTTQDLPKTTPRSPKMPPRPPRGAPRTSPRPPKTSPRPAKILQDLPKTSPRPAKTAPRPSKTSPRPLQHLPKPSPTAPQDPQQASFFHPV